MTELKLDGLTPKELEAAREALVTLYELKDEYAKAKRYLDSVEMQMAQRYDTVNRALQKIKECKAATITTCQITERKGDDDGR